MRGIERDLRDEELAARVLGHDADRLVLIAIDDEALLRRNREERQHVAARQRRDERFLRIDRVLPGHRQRHDRAARTTPEPRCRRRSSSDGRGCSGRRRNSLRCASQRTVARVFVRHRASRLQRSTSRIPGIAPRSSVRRARPRSLIFILRNQPRAGRVFVDRAGRRFERGVDRDHFAGNRRVDFACGLHALDHGGFARLSPAPCRPRQLHDRRRRRAAPARNRRCRRWRCRLRGGSIRDPWCSAWSCSQFPLDV